MSNRYFAGLIPTCAVVLLAVAATQAQPAPSAPIAPPAHEAPEASKTPEEKSATEAQEAPEQKPPEQPPAQEDEASEEAPAEQPTAPAPEAPAEQPTAPAPEAPVEQPTAPAPEAPPEQPTALPTGKRLVWRNSTFGFGQHVSKNTIFKEEQLSYNPVYIQTFSLAPRFYLSDTLSLRLRQDLAFEITEPDEYGPYAGYSMREKLYLLNTLIDLMESRLAEYRGVLLAAGLRLNLPTAISSQARRRILGTGPMASLTKSFDKVLEGMVLRLSGRWIHHFHLSNVRAAEDDYPCLRASGASSDASSSSAYCLGGTTNYNDEFLTSISVELTPVARLDLSASFALAWLRGAPLAGARIETLTGEVVIEDQSVTHWRYATGAALGVGYMFTDFFHLALSINSQTAQLNPDGSLRNPLINPDTLFSLDATFTLDQLYLAIAGPRRETATASSPVSARW